MTPLSQVLAVVAVCAAILEAPLVVVIALVLMAINQALFNWATTPETE